MSDNASSHRPEVRPVVEPSGHSGNHDRAGTAPIDKRSYFESMADDVTLDRLDRTQQLLEQRRAEIIVDLLQVEGGSPKVIDVGCGEGLLLSMIAKRNPAAEVMGLDLSEKRLVRARGRVPELAAVCADIEATLPLRHGSCDRVACSEVVEHLADPAAFLGRLRAVMKPTGLLVLTVPYNQQLQWVRCTHCGRLTSEHLHSFDEANMASLLQEAGFVLENLLLPKLYWLGRTARLPFGAWRKVHRLLEATVLRRYKPPYMFCAARVRA